MTDLERQRRFFAEEVEAACGLRTAAVVEAFASVPRERFLGPGPWLVKGTDGGDIFSAPRPTPDADPRRVYHNVSIVIDPARQLFNGQPATIGAWIDRLAIAAGERVAHVGCGTGYYTAVMAHCVGPRGRVLAFGAAPIGKGVVVLVTRLGAETAYAARMIGFVAIYGAVGVRDDAFNARIGEVLQRNPMPRLARLRRDPHEPVPACWLRGERFCLETEPG